MTRQRSFPATFPLLLLATVVALLALPLGTALAKPAPKRYYAFESAQMTMRMTVWHNHVYRLSLGGTGTCEDGTKAGGFGVEFIAGPGQPLRGKKHRFNHTRLGGSWKIVFRGVVTKRAVKGGYLEYRRQPVPATPGSEEELFPDNGQYCGIGAPKGDYIHFTAHRVGRKAMPKWMR